MDIRASLRHLQETPVDFGQSRREDTSITWKCFHINMDLKLRNTRRKYLWLIGAELKFLLKPQSEESDELRSMPELIMMPEERTKEPPSPEQTTAGQRPHIQFLRLTHERSK
ncbi:hypothetical protein Tco_0060255 [Tanacetum coccineum]